VIAYFGYLEYIFYIPKHISQIAPSENLDLRCLLCQAIPSTETTATLTTSLVAEKIDDAPEVVVSVTDIDPTLCG